MPIWRFISENWTVIGSTTVLSVLVTKLIDWYFKKNEINLSQQNSIEIELLKNKLAIQNTRLQITYSGVVKDQVDSLRSLYEQLLKFEAALNARKSDKKDIQKIIEPFKILNEFKNIYYENGIYIPKSLDEKIKDIIGFCFKQHFNMYSLQAEEAAKDGDLTTANQLSEQEITDTLKLQELRDAFRDEIRQILAIDQ